MLEAHLEECLPLPEDSFIVKGKKVLMRIKAGRNIREIQRTLDTHKSTLTLHLSHLTAMAGSDQTVITAGIDVKFYEVPAMGGNHFMAGNIY